jgi:outer membrane protein TolC
MRGAFRLGVRLTSTIAVGLVLVAISSPISDAGTPAPTAHPVQKITLGQAIQMALEKQPAVMAARASLNSTTIQRDAAFSPMACLTGPAIHVRRQQADLGVSVAHAGVEQAELDAIHAVTRVYLSALYADEQVKVAGDAMTNLKVVHDAAKTLVDAGSKNVFKDDLDRIATYMLIAESKLNEAKLGHARAIVALREAIGVGPDCPMELAGESLARYYEASNKYVREHGGINCRCIVDVALRDRPEVAQAILLADITRLEIQAQGLSLHAYTMTFAATGDIHAKVLPATLINGDYRPGAVAPEMPVYLAGSCSTRKARAAALADRASFVADKVRGLIALEAEEACVRLGDYGTQVALLTKATAQSVKVSEDSRRAYRNDQIGTDRMLTAQVVESQNQASLNEAQFKYAVALAALQHATAGHLWDCLEKKPAAAAAPMSTQPEKLERPPMPKTGK